MTVIEQAQLILKYIIAISSAITIFVVLLQVRSGGLGATFGGSSGGGETYRSKRGVEALLYNSTILLITVFAVASMVLAAISA